MPMQGTLAPIVEFFRNGRKVDFGENAHITNGKGEPLYWKDGTDSEMITDDHEDFVGGYEDGTPGASIPIKDIGHINYGEIKAGETIDSAEKFNLEIWNNHSEQLHKTEYYERDGEGKILYLLPVEGDDDIKINEDHGDWTDELDKVELAEPYKLYWDGNDEVALSDHSDPDNAEPVMIAHTASDMQDTVIYVLDSNSSIAEPLVQEAWIKLKNLSQGESSFTSMGVVDDDGEEKPLQKTLTAEGEESGRISGAINTGNSETDLKNHVKLEVAIVPEANADHGPKEFFYAIRYFYT